MLNKHHRTSDRLSNNPATLILRKGFTMNNLVKITENNKIVTTSEKIAEVFNKQHKNVIRAINKLVGDLSDVQDANRLIFEPIAYVDVRGRQQKQYMITRDGFTLLAMGFTGKKALEWKIKYIQAFNAMEAKLKNVYACGEVSVREHMRSKPSGKKEIVLSEKAKAEIGGIVKACAPKIMPATEVRNLAELVAAKVSANLMYLKRDELATRARALRQQAEVYDESVREYDRNLAQIEKALA